LRVRAFFGRPLRGAFDEGDFPSGSHHPRIAWASPLPTGPRHHGQSAAPCGEELFGCAVDSRCPVRCSAVSALDGCVCALTAPTDGGSGPRRKWCSSHLPRVGCVSGRRSIRRHTRR